MKIEQVKLSNVKVETNLLNKLKSEFSITAITYHSIFQTYSVTSNKRLVLEENK